MPCSICKQPGKTKRNCDHCWTHRRCHALNCPKCEVLGINYGYATASSCPECGIQISTYQNGSIMLFCGYESDFDDEEDYAEYIIKCENCETCKQNGYI